MAIAVQQVNELDWLNDPVVEADVTVNQNVMVGKLPAMLQRLLRWGQGESVWPLTFGIS